MHNFLNISGLPISKCQDTQSSIQEIYSRILLGAETLTEAGTTCLR